MKKVANVCILIAAPCAAVIVVVGIFFPSQVNTWWNTSTMIVGVVATLTGGLIHLSTALLWVLGGLVMVGREGYSIYLYFILSLRRGKNAGLRKELYELEAALAKVMEVEEMALNPEYKGELRYKIEVFKAKIKDLKCKIGVLEAEIKALETRINQEFEWLEVAELGLASL